MTGVNRTKDISTEPHRPAEHSPARTLPSAGAKTGGTQHSPARNSRSYKAQQRHKWKPHCGRRIAGGANQKNHRADREERDSDTIQKAY